MVKVLIADNNFLSRIGLELLVGELHGLTIVPTVSGDFKALQHQIKISKPDLLVLDYPSIGITTTDFLNWLPTLKSLKVILISEPLSFSDYQNLLNSSLHACLLKECGKEEILEAFNAVLNNLNFICGKIIKLTSKTSKSGVLNSYIKNIQCDGILLTPRERHIITCISEGLSNKQIAHKLHLSPHTVATHRKNIFNKLDVNNTAGVVMFAVKNNLLKTQVELHWQ